MHVYDESLNASVMGTKESKLPWLTFAFIYLVFFLATPYNTSLIGQPSPQIQDVILEVKQGNVIRQIVIALLFVWAAFVMIKEKKHSFRINVPLVGAIVAFLIWSCLSTMWSSDPILTIKRLVLLFMLCFSAISCSLRLSGRDILVLMVSTSLATVIIGFIAEVALGSFHPFLDSSYRFTGLMHPNSEALICAILVMSALSLIHENQYFSPILYGICGISLLFLFLTKSRTTLASFIISILVYWILTVENRRKAIHILLAVIVASAGYFAFEHLRQKDLIGIAFLNRDLDQISTLNGRILVWEQVMQYVGKNPFMGAGYGAFWIPSRIAAVSWQQEWAVGMSHSNYLDMLAELGIIGAIVFLLILIISALSSILTYIRRNDHFYAFIASYIILFSLNMVLEGQFPRASMPSFLFMVLIARISMDPVVEPVLISSKTQYPCGLQR